MFEKILYYYLSLVEDYDLDYFDSYDLKLYQFLDKTFIQDLPLMETDSLHTLLDDLAHLENQYSWVFDRGIGLIAMEIQNEICSREEPTEMILFEIPVIEYRTGFKINGKNPVIIG